MPFYELSENEVAVLNRPVVGRGGFQSFLTLLQSSVNEDGRIFISATKIPRLLAYSQEMGQGGFQNRLVEVFMRHIDLATGAKKEVVYPE
jgi:hypothetical protein